VKIGIIMTLVLVGVFFVIPNSYAEEIVAFFIHPQLVDCVGVGPMKCMQIRENENSEWQNFYDKIQGFDFVQGVSYQITVKITDVENPPADASSKKYELIEIIKQESTTEHFPYKNTCAPGFVPLGEICVLNDRCGPGIYPGKVCFMDGIMHPYLRPSQQGNAGIPASNVICAEGLKQMFKSHDGSPACVKPQSVQTLKERGWQTFMPAIACTLEYVPVCGVNWKTYGNSCALNADHIALNHNGECKTRCSSNDQCSDDLVCREGICQKACSIQCLVYDPVCGVDGVTYGCGEEDVKCNGVEVEYKGECKDIAGTG
jgi:hypothetical protein